MPAPMTWRFSGGLLHLLGLYRNLGRCRPVHPGNCLANQALDSTDGLAVDRRDNRDCRTASSSPARAADAMDIIIGVVWHVEIENVAHLRDVEAACGNVRGNEQFHFTAAKLVKGRHACGLVHVPVQGDGVELMAQQRAMKIGDFALPVAKDDRVLEVVYGPDQAAQRIAFFVWITAGRDKQLGDRRSRAEHG